MKIKRLLLMRLIELNLVISRRAPFDVLPA